MKIAIPSYRRYDELGKKTLTFLSGMKGFCQDDITIFVADEIEYNLYIEHNPGYNIVIGEKGIVNIRNFISQYYDKDEYIVCLDDDIEGLVSLLDKDYSTLFIDAKREMDSLGLTLWGVNAVSNKFFMENQDEISHNLKFCIGVIHGYINKKYVLPIQCAQKEDYVTTIMHYRDWGGVVRYNWISPKTKFFAKGGLESKKERSAQNEIAAHYISERYPDYCKMFRRKDGTAELRLNFRHRFEFART